MVELKKEKSCPQAVDKNASNEGSHTLRKPFTSCCQSGYRITAVYETETGTRVWGLGLGTWGREEMYVDVGTLMFIA